MFNAIDAETGLPFRLFNSEALSAELAKFRDGECQHNQQSICDYTDAGGNKHFKRQCQTCGEMKGKAVGKAAVGSEVIVPHQPDLQKTYQAARERERQAILQRHIGIQKADSGWFSKAYKLHMESEKWQHIRRKVMTRANNICEGCLGRPATQVHHKHYENLGDEFMFDLLALCEPCHERLHPKELSSEDVEAEVARLDCQCRWGDDHGAINPQCNKFGVSVAAAIAQDGECGPQRREREGYK